MDYKYIAQAEQTLETLNEAINILEQQEKIRSNLNLYNFALLEINRARSNNEVSYINAEKRFKESRNYKFNLMNKYKVMGIEIMKNKMGNIDLLSYKQIYESVTTSNS